MFTHSSGISVKIHDRKLLEISYAHSHFIVFLKYKCTSHLLSERMCGYTVGSLLYSADGSGPVPPLFPLG